MHNAIIRSRWLTAILNDLNENAYL